MRRTHFLPATVGPALVAAVLVTATPLAATLSAAEPVRPTAFAFSVEAGKFDRAGAVLRVPVPAGAGNVAWRLVRGDGKEVPIQLEPGPEPVLTWMLEEPLPAGASRAYRCEPLAPPAEAPPPAVTAEKTAADVLLAVGGKPVLRYRHTILPSPDPQQPWYDRSGFIHPIYDPEGHVLTDAHPADHLHQHAVMFAWVATRFEGRKVDFWNSHKKQGLVRHVALDALVSGPVFGGLTARLEHIDLTAPGGEKAVLHETWTLRVYRRNEGFLFDLISVQSCAGQSPLVIEKYHYGGLCVRGRADWFKEGRSDFLTSAGKTRRDGNGTRPVWCDLGGRPGPDDGGLATIPFPLNFAYPQPVRLHPDKPYFSFAPGAVGEFSIEPGKPFVSAYRFHAHVGKVDAAGTDLLARDLTDPPSIRFVPYAVEK